MIGWEPQPGARFGRYRLGDVIGRGAVGTVFAADRIDGGGRFAVKVLKQPLSRDDVFRRRFEHEVRAAGSLRHPNLVPVVDAGEVDGIRFLAMPFVDGPSLDSRLESGGPMSAAEVTALVSELAAGLDALHRAGLVHRDVKPSNVLLGPAGAALTDFGLAKGRAYTVLTRPGEIMGTLQYVAPELLSGGAAAPPADIYSLGCVVFECVSGAPPFAARGMVALALAHLEQQPPDPCAQRDDLPPELSFAVLTALAKDPAQRPRTATAYATLVRVAAGL